MARTTADYCLTVYLTSDQNNSWLLSYCLPDKWSEQQLITVLLSTWHVTRTTADYCLTVYLTCDQNSIHLLHVVHLIRIKADNSLPDLCSGKLLIIFWHFLHFQMIIEVPHTWTEMDCRTPLSPACLPPQGIRVGASYCNIKTYFFPQTVRFCTFMYII